MEVKVETKYVLELDKDDVEDLIKELRKVDMTTCKALLYILEGRGV
jgi:hypothetical protein